jgi:hypothetical protein
MVSGGVSSGPRGCGDNPTPAWLNAQNENGNELQPEVESSVPGMEKLGPGPGDDERLEGPGRLCRVSRASECFRSRVSIASRRSLG